MPDGIATAERPVPVEAPPPAPKGTPATSGSSQAVSNPAFNNQEATSPPTPPDRTFEARAFKSGVGTGEDVGYKDKEAGKAGEMVTVSKETEAQYTYFLKDYLTTFSDAMRLNPSLRDNKAAETGRKLMEILTTEGNPDPAKISKFLTHKEGWIVVTEAMNEYALQLNAVLGFVTDTRPPSERGELLKQERVKIEGSRWFGKMPGFEKPFGAKFLQFNQRSDLFEALKKDPEEKAYIKGVLGINLDDYRLNLTNSNIVEKIPEKLKTTNRSPESLRRNILQLMQARREFLEDLGIPLKNIDSLPEEALITRTDLTQGFGPTGLKWEKEIIDKFNDGFNPAATSAENVARFNKVRREVMLYYVSEIMIKDALKSPDKIASVVTERLRTIDIEGKGGEKERRTKKATAKKTELEAEHETAQNEFAQKEDALLENIPKDLVKTKAAYETFVRVPPGTITPTELENETIDQLIIRATAPPYNMPNATAEEQKALRDMLLRAKTEHKAMQIEEYDQSPQIQRDAFTFVIEPPGATPTINPDNLLTMPQQQLKNLLSQPPYEWSEQIDDSLLLAQQEAKRKLITRHGVYLEEKIKDLDQQIQAQDKIIQNAGNLEKIKETLVMTDIILKRQEKIFKEAIAIPLDTQKYTDPKPVQNTDAEYSQTERDLALPKAYYEILNVLFDYQYGGKIGDKTLTREEYFQRIHNFLPEDKLLGIMWKYMGIPGPFNFSNLDPNSFTSNTELVIGFRKIINDLGKETIAL